MALAVFVPVWIAVLLYVIALGVASIGFISAEAVVEEIRTQDVKLKKDVSLMRGLQTKIHQMTTQCDDAETVKLVKKLAEEFRYSDPVSSDVLTDVENELAVVVEELQTAIVDGDNEVIVRLCRKASAVLTERNRLCKLNKN